jgi:hypothetical protein
LLWTVAQSLLGPLYRTHLQLPPLGPTNSEELLDDEDLFWDCLSESDPSFTDPNTTWDGGEEQPPILPPADSPEAQLRPTGDQLNPDTPKPDTTSQFPNPEPVASLQRPATPQQPQAPRVNPTGLTRWLSWIPRSDLEGPHSLPPQDEETSMADPSNQCPDMEETDDSGTDSETEQLKWKSRRRRYGHTICCTDKPPRYIRIMLQNLQRLPINGQAD